VFAPVLTPGEAAAHPHNVARKTFVEKDGVMQPAPAPRFSRTPSEIRDAAKAPGEHTDQILAQLGYSAREIHDLRAANVVR
jgi:alpha-methylacyl-CoA racemase